VNIDARTQRCICKETYMKRDVCEKTSMCKEIDVNTDGCAKIYGMNEKNTKFFACMKDTRRDVCENRCA